MISRDGGQTWSDAQRMSFRARHRDGMPSPLILRDGRTVVAIEDNGLSGGVFKPVIVAMEDGRRWGALKEPLDARWYGGAPFLRRVRSGHVLLSYQESEDGDLHRCRMVVCVGDADAKNFTNKTYPIPLGEHGNQAWNSLFVKDDKTVIAISTATVDGVSGIWAIDGRLSTR
jgi:hypothetical protein